MKIHDQADPRGYLSDLTDPIDRTLVSYIHSRIVNRRPIPAILFQFLKAHHCLLEVTFRHDFLFELTLLIQPRFPWGSGRCYRLISLSFHTLPRVRVDLDGFRSLRKRLGRRGRARFQEVLMMLEMANS